jgi:hypothetical protein
MLARALSKLFPSSITGRGSIITEQGAGEGGGDLQLILALWEAFVMVIGVPGEGGARKKGGLERVADNKLTADFLQTREKTTTTYTIQ